MSGYLRRDDDGHWYFVPELLVQLFDNLSEAMGGLDYLNEPDLFEAFINHFSDCRIDNPFSIKFTKE